MTRLNTGKPNLCHDVLLVSFGIAALGLAPGAALAQPTAAPTAFEVASVKLSDPNAPIGALEFPPGGRFVATNVPLRIIIQRAFDVRDFQLLGGPDWLIKELYAIQAKAPEGPVSDAQIRLMVQTLLAERFHLRVHRETKELAVYALVIGKNGPKVEAAKDSPRPGALGVGRGSITARSTTFANVATALSRLLSRPVLDETQLSGNYDFKLHYDQSSVGLPFPGPRQESDAAGQPDGAEPSIFTAVQEQLGLKLDPQKRPVEVVVIDSIARPSEN
jgi:uncharacterized protein (TIGR03435 family)